MWKRALVFSILLAGFSVPAKAQVQFIPIGVYCVKDSESFNALCAKLKQKISGTRDLILRKTGDRYVVILNTWLRSTDQIIVDANYAAAFPVDSPWSADYPHYIFSALVIMRSSETNEVADYLVEALYDAIHEWEYGSRTGNAEGRAKSHKKIIGGDQLP